MAHRTPSPRPLVAVLLLALVAGSSACSDRSGSSCPLPAPFCGGDFPLNTEQTTPYGPAWADVRYGSDQWATCFGPYALCYYASCQPSPDGSVSDCPCYDTFGTSYVLIDSILNADDYQATRSFCDANPGACGTPNAAPVCGSINRGAYFPGATRVSTFSTYRATVEPIGSTDCTDQPGPYAGCMTAPCFGEPVVDPGGETAMIACDCPIYDGPFQVGQSGLSCDDAPLVYSAAYTPGGAPPDPCDLVKGCVPDAPEDACGCPLYVPGQTSLPPGSDVDCAKVCEQYASCQAPDGVELGYTCDATLCTSENRKLDIAACDGLQNCDLSEVFKAEAAAQCSCCATQLCGCEASAETDAEVAALNAAQRAQGETPQCDVNGTLCGLP